jgi:talin
LQFPASERSYQEIQITLNNNAIQLNQAATDIVGAAAGSGSSPHQVAQSSSHFGRAYEDFVDSGLEMAGVTKDTETRTSIVSSLRSVSMTSSKLLITTKSYMADPNAPNSKNLLTQAAR